MFSSIPVQFLQRLIFLRPGKSDREDDAKEIISFIRRVDVLKTKYRVCDRLQAFVHYSNFFSSILVTFSQKIDFFSTYRIEITIIIFFTRTLRLNLKWIRGGMNVFP